MLALLLVPTLSTQPRVVQYFAQWSVYGRGYSPADMHLDAITHIHYAFFDVNPKCEVVSLDEYADFDKVYAELGQIWSDDGTNGNIGAFRILRTCCLAAVSPAFPNAVA